MLLALPAIAGYLLAAALLWRDASATGERSAARNGWLLAAVVALGLHAALHVRTWLAIGGLDMHFFSALSLVGWALAALTAVLGATTRTPAPGVVVFPLSALCLACYTAFATPHVDALDWRMQLHAWSALLAYALLSLAALLAVLLWLQERALRSHRPGALLRGLPPLVSLEALLFRTIGAGFLLLSFTLLVGLVFVEDLMAQHLAHKTVFSLLSWVAFGVLLLGRWRRGWRGVTAVRWTLLAMALLVLAFFGSKFVLELVLQRS